MAQNCIGFEEYMRFWYMKITQHKGLTPALLN